MEAIQTAGDVSVSVSVSGLGSGVQVQGTSGVTDVAGVSGAHTLKFASPKQFRRRHSIDGRVVGVTGEGDGEREGERRERDAENDTERDAEREGERGLPHLTALFHHAAALANPATILSTAKASITSTDDTFAYPPTSKKRYFSIANNYDAESENDNYQYQNYNQHYNQNYNQDYNHDQDRDSDADTSATNVNVDDQVLAHPPSTIIYLDSKRRVNSFVDLNESVFKQTTSNSPPASLNADERIAAEALHALAATTVHQSPTTTQLPLPHAYSHTQYQHHWPSQTVAPTTTSSVPTSISNTAAISSNNSHIHHFIERFSAIPLIHSSLSTFSSAYEATKNASFVVKSSMETMENSTKAVLNTLEPALAPLDRFACNQLDKLERNFPNMISNPPAAAFSANSGSDSIVNVKESIMESNLHSNSMGDVMDDGQSDISRPTTASSRLNDSGLPEYSNSNVITSIPSMSKHFLHETPPPLPTAVVQPAFHQSLPPMTKDLMPDIQIMEQQHQQQPFFQFRRHRSSSLSSETSTISSSGGSVSTVGYESVSSMSNVFLTYDQMHLQSIAAATVLAPSDYSGPITAGAAAAAAIAAASAAVNDGSLTMGGPLSSSSSTAPIIARKPRGMWKSVVQGVQSNLGAIVISEDAVRALKWCLKILQEAAKNIEGQVDILRRYLASYLQNFQKSIDNNASRSNSSSASASRGNSNPSESNTAEQQANNDLNSAISSVTREVVGTLKLVVEMLVKHASSRLPPPARRRVREFILRLPNRWSSLANDVTSTGSSASSSVVATPNNGPVTGKSQQLQPVSTMPTTPLSKSTPTATAAAAAETGSTDVATATSPLPTEAQRVLTLAAESSAMLKNVMNVFAQTVIGAEAVLGRTVDDDVTLPSIQSLKISGGGQPQSQPQQFVQQQQQQVAQQMDLD